MDSSSTAAALRLSSAIICCACFSALRTAAVTLGFSAWNLVVVDIMVKVVEPPMTSSEFMMVWIVGSFSSRWSKGAEAQ
jgi:hypothetical protein